MKIGIVILNYNSFELTCKLAQKCLYMNSIDSIVIVDNDSKDDFTLFSNNSKKIKYIRSQTNRGYATGNNLGLKYLYDKGYDIAFIANPDVDFNEDAIISISDFLAQNNEYAVASCARYLNDNTKTRQFWSIPKFTFSLMESIYIGRYFQEKDCIKKTNEIVEFSKKNGKKYIDVEVIGGAFFGCKLNILNKINYLDENTFLWYEENILSTQLKSNGYKEALILECVYHHNHIKKGRGNKNFSIFIKSKHYYCIQYLKINFIQKILLNILDYIGILEEKIICFIFRR